MKELCHCTSTVLCPYIRVGGRSIFPSDCRAGQTSMSRKQREQAEADDRKQYAENEHCLITQE